MIEKVTVIIPTYKRHRLLIRCLQALADQQIDKNDFRVIVVSDGPDDLTKDAIENWKATVQINLSFLQIEKRGPAAARNHGWRQAKTPLVAFTDDDCIPSPNWLDAFIRAYSGQHFIAFTGRTIVPLPAEKTDFALNLSHLEKAEFITANCACTHAVLDLVGGFDEKFKMAWREDSDLQFKLMVQCIEIMRVEDAQVVHPVREVPWGISIKEQKKGLYDALLFKKYPDLYRKKINSSIRPYYIIMLILCLLLWSIMSNYHYLTGLTAVVLALLFAQFIAKRLKDRHKSFNQVSDMMITSLAIPFLSIFWRIYGSVKYRILFL